MNIQITGNAATAEAQAYVSYLQEKHNRKLESLDIHIDGEYVDLNYKFSPVSFQRIRRITGYLVGTMDNWNDAKSAEEKDRVKHSLGSNSNPAMEQM
ncbi:MAG: anaerobic ribonucleoside-triphosphate reductase [Anaerovoracaceae bacterium]